MLVLLDRSTKLAATLPPSSLPAEEVNKFVEYFHHAASSTQPPPPPPPTPTYSVPPSAAHEHPGTHFLRRWYRQTRQTPSGKSDGDYLLISPPDLAPSTESVFAAEAHGACNAQAQAGTGKDANTGTDTDTDTGTAIDTGADRQSERQTERQRDRETERET
jgi:hypothetical protein